MTDRSEPGFLTTPMAAAFLSFGVGAVVAWRRARRLDRGPAAQRAAGVERLIRRTGLLFLLGLALTPTAFGLPLQIAAIGWYVHGWARATVADGHFG